MHFDFEELTPVGYPGVLVTGWAEIEMERRAEWYVDAVYVGDCDSATDWALLPKTDPLAVAITKTLLSGAWASHINEQLWG
jgi:hypothetical protein